MIYFSIYLSVVLAMFSSLNMVAAFITVSKSMTPNVSIKFAAVHCSIWVANLVCQTIYWSN